MTTAGPRATPSGDRPAPSGEFRALTGLRIVAAAWVVIFHFHFTPLAGVARVAGWFGPLITQGALGVDLFFVLSGFVIAFTYLDKLGPALRMRSTARFVWARTSRMWPVYVLVLHLFGLWLVARLAFGSGGDIAYQSVQPVVDVGQWLQQVFMVQMWDNAYFDGASWVGPTWSLSAEWLAYLLFPLTALGFFRMRNLPAPVLALGAVALMTPIAWACLSTGGPYYPWSWAVRVLCGFGAGVLAYLTVRRLRAGEQTRRRASGIAAVTPLLITAGLVAGEFAGPGRGGVVIVLFPVLVGALALADRGPAMVLTRPLMVGGGRISFSLYLVHIPIFEVFWTVLRHGDVTGRPAYFAALAVLLSTVMVAAIAYYAVEEPARRRMRRIALPERRPATLPVVELPVVELPVVEMPVPSAAPVADRQVARPGFVPPRPRTAATSESDPTPAGIRVPAQGRPARGAAPVAALHRAEQVSGD